MAREYFKMPDNVKQLIGENDLDSVRVTIKDRLKSNSLTQVWLINQLTSQNIHTDKSELSSVLSGTRRGDKASAIVLTAKKVLNDYEGVYEL